MVGVPAIHLVEDVSAQERRAWCLGTGAGRHGAAPSLQALGLRRDPRWRSVEAGRGRRRAGRRGARPRDAQPVAPAVRGGEALAVALQGLERRSRGRSLPRSMKATTKPLKRARVGRSKDRCASEPTRRQGGRRRSRGRLPRPPGCRPSPAGSRIRPPPRPPPAGTSGGRRRCPGGPGTPPPAGAARSPRRAKRTVSVLLPSFAACDASRAAVEDHLLQGARHQVPGLQRCVAVELRHERAPAEDQELHGCWHCSGLIFYFGVRAPHQAADRERARA